MSTGQIIPEDSVPARAPIYQPTGATITRYKGEVVYIFAFDIAYDMKRQPITTLMGQPVSQFAVDTSKRNPRAAYFYRSQSVRLPDVERMSPRGLLRMQRAVKILPVGALSITVRIPFEIQELDELVALHDLKFTDGRYLREDVRAWAEEIRKELGPYSVRPLPSVGEDEAYTVFCIDAPLRTPDGKILSGEDWLVENRRALAALLTEEDAPENLSDQEAEESTGRYLSYYDQDLVVVDWDAAVIVDEPRYRDEIIYILELANLQLAELEAYDRLLDAAVESLYRDLGARRFRRLGFRTDAQLQELRVDMARVTDELSNITKFFGDWHLARIYQVVSSRFHLADWHRTVDDKLKTIDEIYQLLRAEQNNRLMMTLEVLIVILFVVDVALIFIKK